MKLTLQVKNKKGDLETLTYTNGRIKCTCLKELYNKNRDINAECSHARKLREDIEKSGSIDNFLKEKHKDYYNLLTT